MKNSIGLKLFIGINGIIILFIMILWILNSQFLQQYYIVQKKSMLTNAYKKIDSVYTGKPQDISDTLSQFEQSSGIRILIFSTDNSRKYDSFLHSFDVPPQDRTKNNNQPHVGRSDFPINPNNANGFNIKFEPQFNTGFLNLSLNLNNGDFIQLGIPISAIQENVSISNQFMIYIGIFSILIGSLISFLFSRRFTKPVLELKKIAQNMSNLDFSQKYTVKSNDEIGTLGKSINSLSEQLDKSITELRLANGNLEQDIKQKIKLDEMRKEFIYSVSHELKTPITLIQGYAEGLKSNVNQDEDSREFYCDVIMDESKKMNKMVMELLELAQIESGYMTIEKNKFDLSELLDKVMEKYSIVFNEKGINLQFEKQQKTIVYADQSRIEQVIVNYINNAINHIDGQKIIKVKMSLETNTVKVSVFNTGRNIPTEQFDCIWDSFYKVDKARTRAYGGAGLGLSIVRVIMNLHNTSYGVENHENGVLFWFEVQTA